MRKTLIALMVLPVVALAQGPNKTSPQAGQQDPARAEKRMRLARTLGLAEALDLDTAQALKLGDTLAKFDERRKAARKQAGDATDVLRNAARGNGNGAATAPKATAADVDGAITSCSTPARSSRGSTRRCCRPSPRTSRRSRRRGRPCSWAGSGTGSSGTCGCVAAPVAPAGPG